MKPFSVRLVLSLVAVLTAMGGAGADCKVVTPSNLQGMVMGTVSSGFGALTDPVPPPGGALGAGGSGALYMTLGGEGSGTTGDFSGQVWFGTNAYAGVKLSDLTTLTYEIWCSNSGIWNVAQAKWSPPRQPCTLRLVIDTKDPQDPTPIRMLMFRPIKLVGAGEPGYGFAPYPEDFNYLNRWKTCDCLYGAEGCWAEFTYNVTPCLWTGPWFGAGGVLEKYPNAEITIPGLQVGGQWPPAYPVDTPNGCGLSLEWGAESKGGGDWPTQPWKNWWREAFNAVGFADYLQVGVGANLDIYDFEADGKNDPVVANGKGFQEKAAGSGCRNWPFVVYGRAVTCTLPRWDITGWKEADHFCLDDGSGQQCEVVCQRHMVIPVTIGKYYRVLGRALPRYSLQKGGDPVPMRIHTDAYTYPPLVTELVETPE